MTRAFFQRASLLALVAALILPASLAQAQQQPQQPQRQQAPEVEASTQEIDKVAEILLEIGEVQRKYQTQIRQAHDKQKARALQKQMRSEINQTVEEFDGLSAERYDKITRAARADSELKQKILSRLNEKREEKKNN